MIRLCRRVLKHRSPARCEQLSGFYLAEEQAGGFFLLALPAAALQAIDGYKHVGPFEYLNQLVKDALVIVWSGL